MNVSHPLLAKFWINTLQVAKLRGCSGVIVCGQGELKISALRSRDS